MAMKLILQPYSDHSVSENVIYEMTKSFYSIVESRDLMSAQLIQAALLIALYELGHGLYPAAYLSIGHCARLCYAIGLHDQKGALSMLPKYFTWTEHVGISVQSIWS